MEFWEYLLIILGGFIAGGMNSLAGYGSLITLTILMEIIGLPGNIANATNRVNVAANVLAGSAAFYKNGKLKLGKSSLPIIVLVVIGAILGSIAAALISNEDFRIVYRILLLFVAILLFINPKKWLIKESIVKNINWFILAPVLLILGFYGGFIQAGLGMFVLATLVLLVGKEIIEANALKMFIILCYSVFVIAIFHYQGLIDWKAGALLAVSQATGSFLVANYVSKIPNANLYAYRLLILIISFIIIREFYTIFS